ncbi:MAG: hypothetical protein IJR66_03585 [Clostridia bacterium]|nr:hypothetical protein [Clostridia bacterium]
MQKKLLSFIYIPLSIVAILLIFSINGTPLFSDYGLNGEVYLKSYSSSCKILKNDERGFLAEIYKTGEATEVNSADAERILKDFSATTVFIEETDGIKEIFAYSKKIRYKKRINGKIINLHIITTKNTVKVGSPIIFGSF